jgi:uncharacterized Zn finger protein
MARTKKTKPARAYEPVSAQGRNLASTWWGKAWNSNLESYSDYSNRIPRGRSYLRQGAVIDLHIEGGEVSALVQGRKRAPYRVSIRIDTLEEKRWKRISEKCGRRVENLEALVSGSFPADLSELFSQKGEGLFPAPDEIAFSCSCPDWAYMCKHVAASLYGIGARLDSDPLLFFKLRGIDVSELLAESIDRKVEEVLGNSDVGSSRMISDDEAAALFGVAFDPGSSAAPDRRPEKKEDAPAKGAPAESGADRRPEKKEDAPAKSAPAESGADRKSGKIPYGQACQTILDHLAKNKKITTPVAAELLRVPDSQARSLLNRMAKNRILKVVGKTKGRYYRLYR